MPNNDKTSSGRKLFRNLMQFLNRPPGREESPGRLKLQALEPRILYDASPLGVLLDQWNGGPDDGPVDPLELWNNIDQVAATQDMARHEVVFVDSSVTDARALFADLQSRQESGIAGVRFDVYLIDANSDGVAQISDLLSVHVNISAIHIVSHGEKASVQLGNTVLNSGQLAGYAGQLAGWGSHLGADADILFYGCDLATNADGKRFVDSISALTGADVAASEDLTGHTSLGGNWDLEFHSGQIETGIAFSAKLQNQWFGVLANVTVNTVSDVSDGNTTSIANLIATPGADGVISFREAILAANNTAGADTINFNIAGSGPHTIVVTSVLPTITEALVIDGWSEPDFAGTPVIELNGAGAGTGANGLNVNASGSTIRGLVINRFSNSGIQLNNVSNSIIVGNYIGTNVSGTADLGNTGNGITINGGFTNTIGGLTAAERNVISGNNSHGVSLQGNTTGNTVQGNYIGTNAAGTAALGNSNWGIAINSGANNNTIGGTTASARNVISGNSIGLDFTGAGTINNVVSGNYIGLNAAGNAAIANTSGGISIISSAHGNIIGGPTVGHRNVLAGAATDGIRINGANNTQILNNYIGTDATGTIDLGFLQEGVEVMNATGTIVGLAGQGNLLSGNGIGMSLQTGAVNTTVQGNRIGTNAAGTGPLGNDNGGIGILSGANNSMIGGTGAGDGNIIAFNTTDGFWITGTAIDHTILGNSIHSNSGEGIDLNSDGVTPNDPGDPDSGPNHLKISR